MKSLSEQLPSFFVVGAQKAGTSSLHDWLVQQPDVCLPTLKETQFFTFEKLYARGIDWYLKQFPKCNVAAVKGEVCPDYMFFPDAASRIRQHIKSPKFIFVFRHPLKRAYSQYLMSQRNGHETLSFADALLAEEQRLATGTIESLSHFSYMARGRYGEQVEHFRQLFPDSEMLFIRFEDLIDGGETGDRTYADICRFIGLESSPQLVDRTSASNVASVPRFTGLRDFLHKESALKRLLARIIPGRMFKVWVWSKVDRLNQQAVIGQKAGEVPEQFRMAAEVEVVKLKKLTGVDLINGASQSFDKL